MHDISANIKWQKNETFTSNHSTLHDSSYGTMCYAIFHPSAQWLSVATASPANALHENLPTQIEAVGI